MTKEKKSCEICEIEIELIYQSMYNIHVMVEEIGRKIKILELAILDYEVKDMKQLFKNMKEKEKYQKMKRQKEWHGTYENLDDGKNKKLKDIKKWLNKI